MATVYDGDWNLFITGKDTAGNFKLWSLIYGDGGASPTGSWSELTPLASAPADSGFEYHHAFLAKPDVYRGFFIEKFSGTEAYSRPFWSYTIPDTDFADNRWHEPVPFNLSSEYGLAIAYHGNYDWLANPSGVWRAKLTAESLDLTADILRVRQELSQRESWLTVELNNSDGQYSSPGEGSLKALALGSELQFSPGYVTSGGNEVSPGAEFWIDASEHTSAGGIASLILYASDGWSLIKHWRARCQFRWNKDSDEMSVKDILALVLARCGLKLEIKSQSSVLDSYYPDFTIPPGSRGDAVISKLLSFVPDVIFIEGSKAYVVNPIPNDNPVYSYGSSHPIVEGRYLKGGWELNRVQVEGYDPVNDKPMIVDSFSWDEINRLYDRLCQLEDQNINSVSQAQQRGEVYLRQAEIASSGGIIHTPPNCGQQLYDVIDLTDSRAGLNGEKRRVLGLDLVYHPRRGKYEARLALGRV